MTHTIEKFAESLNDIEEEIGLEQLNALLANSLLYCSARLVGDAVNSWSVDTEFIKGEITAITDAGLENNIGIHFHSD